MVDQLIMLKGIPEIMMLLAGRLKDLRLLKNLKRKTLAERAGVSLSSLKRFEETGKVSLEGFLKIVHVLGRLDEFDGLLMLPEAKSIEELERRNELSIPKRGRI